MQIVLIVILFILLIINWLLSNAILKELTNCIRLIDTLIDTVILIENQIKSISKIEPKPIKINKKNNATNSSLSIEVLTPMTHEELEIASKEQLNN